MRASLLKTIAQVVALGILVILVAAPFACQSTYMGTDHVGDTSVMCSQFAGSFDAVPLSQNVVFLLLVLIFSVIPSVGVRKFNFVGLKVAITGPPKGHFSSTSVLAALTRGRIHSKLYA